MIQTNDENWLLVFYTLPSKPVGNRMKIWRKLASAGAVQLKGAVYILPATEEHYELFEWLISEVTSMGGDGTFVKVPSIETMRNDEIITLFNKAREEDYGEIEKKLESLDRKIQSMKKGTRLQNVKSLRGQAEKLTREYEDIHAVDFFSSSAGKALLRRIKALNSEIKTLAGPLPAKQAVEVKIRQIKDYIGKTWVTRKNPYVDRMASAWLIKRFLDKRAVFKFIDEKNLESLDKKAAAFDIRGGEFTHIGDMCTFEVLIKAFGLKDKTLKKIAGIVHELDIKDEKHKNPEAKGVEDILTGIRKTAKGDSGALEKGMAVFEMLYASKI